MLCWCAKYASQWKTFVANRVSEVQTLLPKHQWRYTPTKSNPANLASRGSTPKELLGSQLWWQGPECLSLDSSHWPNQLPHLDPNANTKIKVKTHVAIDVQAFHIETEATFDKKFMEEFSDRYSSWSKLVRITAWVRRFLKLYLAKLRKLPCSFTPYLTFVELKNAETRWYVYLQSIQFPNEFRLLKNKEPVSSKSPLASLNPYLDSEGLIRVGSRLNYSDLPHNTEHPTVLAKHKIVDLIIQRVHR